MSGSIVKTLAAAAMLTAALEAGAVPPEVQNLRFDTDPATGEDRLIWDAGSGALHHVYRGELAQLPADYGACLIGSVRGNAATVPEDPAAAQAYFYLVSNGDATGEGTAGFDTGGGERIPTTACVPARRFFDLAPNGDPGDGVEDGREPRRNPSAMVWSPGDGTIPAGLLLPAVQSAREAGRQSPGAGGTPTRSLLLPAVQRPRARARHRGFYIIDRSYPRSLPEPARAEGEILDLPGMLRQLEQADSSTGVYLHSGEFFLRAVHVAIPARGKTIETWRGSDIATGVGFARGGLFELTEHYRSQVDYDGPLGFGWDSNVNARLAPLGTDVLYHDGSGRRETFLRQDATHFTSPAGRYAVLRENADGSFSMRDPDGTIHGFHAFDGSNLEGAIESVEDPHGNRLTFQYDHQGLLESLTDPMGRAVALTYDAAGRITEIRDFFDRPWSYAYDAAGNLTSVTSPPVTGTPNGNDFPAGKTTSHTYDPDHNLLSVIRPNDQSTGTPSIQNVYGTEPGQFEFDRVVSQTIGGTNASGVSAGGTLTYAWESLNPGGDPLDLALPRRRATVFDRNGNKTESVGNSQGNTISLTRFTNREIRPAEPDYTTEYGYNADGEIVQVIRPLGDRILLTYDTPGADRFREGNLLEARRVAETVAAGGRGDGRGADVNDLVWTYAYEPVFNRLVAATDPRGNDAGYVPQNGGPSSPARYTTNGFCDYEEGDPATNGIDDLAGRFEIDLSAARSNLGDLNGDGRTDQAGGNLVRLEAPAVALDPASNQAGIEGDTSQEIVTLYSWNDLGQLTVLVDAEENRHELQYHPETDPDGDGTPTPAPPDGRVLDSTTGGYLATRLRDTASAPGRNNATDPPPAAIREDYEYDPVGNVTGVIDGRGVLTRRLYNSLNQVVEQRTAAATADAAGPDGDPATGRGEAGLTPFSFKTRLEYDANDNLVGEQIEDRDLSRGVGSWVDVTYQHDILDNRIEVQREATPLENLVVRYRYDANENLNRIVEPEGNERARIYDERELLFQDTRGSAGPRGGAPATRTYDYDGHVSLTRRVDARGNPTDYEYDGHDRLVRRVDQVGNTEDLFWDPASSVVRRLVRGPVGGPTPADRSGSTNVDLADTRYLRDELDRVFREDRGLFVPLGTTPARPALLEEGPSLPGDGFVNRIVEHDRLSRTTFVVEDTGATVRTDYDGLGRKVAQTLPDGSTVQYAFDANDNRVETLETELSSSAGPPDEQFFTTIFFDALDRETSIVDNLGQTRRYLYDSLDGVVTETDPDGPAGGTINRRTPGHTGVSVSTNDHGNVTEHSYDGAGRLLTVRRILTASGNGDGTTSPTPDPTQSGDGFVTTSFAWDRNSLLGSTNDDNGNTTAYLYDNLDRETRRTADDDTRTDYLYDTEDNLTHVTDPNGSVILHTYDAANRRTRTDATPASGLEGTTGQTFEHDGRNLMTRASDDNDPLDSTDDTAVEVLRDSLGRTIEEQQTFGSGAVATALVDLGWRAGDLLTRMTYPDGREVQYGYDPQERLDTVTDAARSESAGYEYFGLGRVHTRSYGNGLRMTLLSDDGSTDVGYDGARRIVRMRHLDGGNALVAGFEHTYDGASNRLSERRTHHPTGPAGEVRGELYAFDSADRLIDFDEGDLDDTHAMVGPPVDEQQFTLDGVGNWAQFSRNGVDYCQDVNNLNEYDEDQSGDTRVDDGVPDDFGQECALPIPNGRNHAHDKNGNLTDQGGFQIVRDFLNRAVRVIRNADGATVGRYKWDAFDRRVRREVTGSGALDETRRYLYTPSSPRNDPVCPAGYVKKCLEILDLCWCEEQVMRLRV